MASVETRTTTTGAVRYDVRYRVQGRSKMVTFNTAAEAQAFRAQVERLKLAERQADKRFAIAEALREIAQAAS